MAARLPEVVSAVVHSDSLSPEVSGDKSLSTPLDSVETFSKESEELRRSGASQEIIIARLEERFQKTFAQIDQETAELQKRAAAKLAEDDRKQGFLGLPIRRRHIESDVAFAQRRLKIRSLWSISIFAATFFWWAVLPLAMDRGGIVWAISGVVGVVLALCCILVVLVGAALLLPWCLDKCR